MTILDKPLGVTYHEVNAYVVDNFLAVVIGLLVLGALWIFRDGFRVPRWPWERAYSMATIEEEKAERIAMGECVGDILMEAVANGKLRGDRALVWNARLGNILTLPTDGEPLKERLKKVCDLPFDPPVKTRKKIVLKNV